MSPGESPGFCMLERLGEPNSQLAKETPGT
jgi:hypothetical protein